MTSLELPAEPCPAGNDDGSLWPRALATGLPVLLLDEPTVGLDQQARNSVLRILERAKGQRSLVVASHDEAVLALADEVVSVS